MAKYLSTFFRQYTSDFAHQVETTLTLDTNQANAPLGYNASKEIPVTADFSTIDPAVSGSPSLGYLYNWVQGGAIADDATVHMMVELITPDTAGQDVVIALIDKDTLAAASGNESYIYLTNAGDMAYFTHTTINDTESNNPPAVIAGIDGGTGDAVIRWSVYYEV